MSIKLSIMHKIEVGDTVRIFNGDVIEAVVTGKTLDTFNAGGYVFDKYGVSLTDESDETRRRKLLFGKPEIIGHTKPKQDATPH